MRNVRLMSLLHQWRRQEDNMLRYYRESKDEGYESKIIELRNKLLRGDNWYSSRMDYGKANAVVFHVATALRSCWHK